MNIFGIKLDKLSYADFFAKITKFKKQTIVFTPNPEMLLSALHDNDFKKTLQKADFLIPDGIGLYVAAQIQSASSWIRSVIMLPIYLCNIIFNREHLFEIYGDKISGSDLTEDLLHYAQEKSIHITVIDPYFPQDKAKCDAQKVFEHKLQKAFPELSFDFYIYKERDKKTIIKKIAASNSKILFSTLGMKKQEESVLEILKECPNILLGLGVGSSFDYFTGFQKRAPSWLQSLELEWLYRLFSGPQKLKRVKRLWNAIFVFIFQVYKRR